MRSVCSTPSVPFQMQPRADGSRSNSTSTTAAFEKCSTVCWWANARACEHTEKGNFTPTCEKLSTVCRAVPWPKRNALYAIRRRRQRRQRRRSIALELQPWTGFGNRSGAREKKKGFDLWFACRDVEYFVSSRQSFHEQFRDNVPGRQNINRGRPQSICDICVCVWCECVCMFGQHCGLRKIGMRCAPINRSCWEIAFEYYARCSFGVLVCLCAAVCTMCDML